MVADFFDFCGNVVVFQKEEVVLVFIERILFLCAPFEFEKMALPVNLFDKVYFLLLGCAPETCFCINTCNSVFLIGFAI